MVMLVVDTNILILATPTNTDFDSEAVEFIWSIVNLDHCIAVDEDGKIVEREYKKHMRENRMLIVWWKFMLLKKKIKYRSGQGPQICDLEEMDNCFACVAMRTPDQILVTEDKRDFNAEVQRVLARRGVRTFCLHNGYTLVCRGR